MRHIRGIGGSLFYYIDRWWYIPDGSRVSYPVEWYELPFVLIFGSFYVFRK